MRRESCSVLVMAGRSSLFIPRQYVVCATAVRRVFGLGTGMPRNHLKNIDDMKPIVVRIAQHAAANVHYERLQLRAAYSESIRQV
jgi:hypothetical protein